MLLFRKLLILISVNIKKNVAKLK